MSDAELDRNNLELALRCIEQIRKCAEQVRSRIGENPENAEDLARPSVCLLEKLLEAQAEVQGLIDEVNRAELLAVYAAR
jgi:hypothetical protein